MSNQPKLALAYYELKYTEHYGVAPVVNRYTARFGFDAMLDDLGKDGVKEIIDYYFTTASTNGHDLKWLFNNYDKLVVKREAYKEEDERIQALRDETQQRLEEWRKKFAKD